MARIKSSSIPATTFHLFPWLPIELRFEIWRLCLPHRVCEKDLAFYHISFDRPDDNTPTPCFLYQTTEVNGRPPVITRVCHESRAVALKTGGYYEFLFCDTDYDAMFGYYVTYSIAVFMLMQAVEDLAQAKQLEQQEEKKKEEEARRKKNLILLIISVVLMFVPVVGEEVAAAAGFASLARAIALTGELGNGVLTIYDTVEDPSSAVLKILGMLLGVGSIAKVSRDASGIGSIAKIRNAMKTEDIASLGKLFEYNDDKLQGIIKVCRHP